MRTLLDEFQTEYGFTIEEIDITRDADLLARYRHDIPVLLMEGTEVARGRISDRELVEMLTPGA
jgi:hypothetical protein